MFQSWTTQTCTNVGSSFVIQSESCTCSKNLSSCCRSLARIQSALAMRPRNPPSATVVKASTGGALSSGATRVRPRSVRWWLSCRCRRETAQSRTAARASNGSLDQENRLIQADGSLRSLRRGQFAAGEQGHAGQAHQTTEQQHDLRESLAELAPGNAPARAQGIHRRETLNQVDHLQHRPEKRQDHAVDPADGAGAGLMTGAA